MQTIASREKKKKRTEGESFLDKQKLKGFLTTKLTIQEIRKAKGISLSVDYYNFKSIEVIQPLEI